MSITYQHALITGASSGLGRGLALWFARRGVVVYAAARRKALLDSLRTEAGENIVPLVLDVSKGDATYERVAALDAECGGLDVVMANAGLAAYTSGKALEWRAVRKVIGVNVTGALATLSGAPPGMVSRDRGHLVGVSSLAAFIAAPRMSTYCAAKTFLAMWLESIRLDVGRSAARVVSRQNVREALVSRATKRAERLERDNERQLAFSRPK